MTTTPNTLESKENKTRSTHRIRVREAVYHMHSLGITLINVEKISETTGLSRQQVTDAIKDLKTEGSVWTPKKGSGLYLPLESQLPSEAVTLTRFPCGGGGKIEKGDLVMECTQNELSLLAMMLAGHAANEMVLEHIAQTIAMAAELQKVKAQLKAYAGLMHSDPNQLKLEV